MIFDIATAMTPFLIMIVIYFYYRMNKLEKYLIVHHRNLNKKLDGYDEEISKINERLEKINAEVIIDDNEGRK